MKRDWGLIRGLLRAIDIDYNSYDRLRFIEALANSHSVISVNYYLSLLYEAKLVRYSKPFYSSGSRQLEAEPIQLTKEGVELLALMNNDDILEQVSLILIAEKDDANLRVAAQQPLFSALKKYFMSAVIAK